MENELLQPQLDQAREALATALDLACGVNIGQASTDELVRIEETLATATSAAKELVTLRLRRRLKRAAPALADTPAISQRVFDDIRGKRWRVFAVHPSGESVHSGALPDSYRDGWLSFEAVDEKRRVAPIPAGWEELAIDELRLLCNQAKRAPKRISEPVNPPEPTSQ